MDGFQLRKEFRWGRKAVQVKHVCASYTRARDGQRATTTTVKGNDEGPVY